MSVSVVVPWRGGCPHREAAWAFVHRRHEEAGHEVVVGSCGGDWCKAVAVADAIDQATGDVLVIADADVWCDELAAAVEGLGDRPWAVPHTTVHRLNPKSTAGILGGASFDDVRRGGYAELPYRGRVGGGMVIIRREAWEAVPIDPRFIGWGQEDDSWGLALRTLLGPAPRFGGRLWHLWHPPQKRLSRRRGSDASFALYLRYLAADGKPDAMRALLKEVTDAALAG